MNCLVKKIERESDMTANEFAVLCEKHLVHPAIALEDDEIVDALRCRDDERVEALLASS